MGTGGAEFGTLITWFLIGGDFYTAYTVIAVPAALYGTAPTDSSRFPTAFFFIPT